MKKILCLMLGLMLTLAATFSFTACGSEQTPKESERITYDGTHVFNVTDTENKIVSNGLTDYIVVYPEQTDEILMLAVTEFQDFFREATGIAIDARNDGAENFSANQKYISIGNTSLLESSGIDVEAATTDLGLEGVRILTQGNSVFVFGNSSSACCFGVYDLLNVYFNYECYYVDCIEIDKGVTDLKFKTLDVKDVPDIAHRRWNYGIFNGNNTFQYRMRTIYKTMDMCLPVCPDYTSGTANANTTIHNALTFLPPDVYGNEHPLWYMDNKRQLCYLAHGDEVQYRLMVEEIAKKIEHSLTLYTPEEYPLYNNVAMAMEDVFDSCGCEACAQNYLTYGANSASFIKLINNVSVLVEEWMAKEENAAYRRDMHYMFLAYNDYSQAPAKLNATTGEYEPVAPDVKFNAKCGVWYAPISDLDWQQSLYAEINSQELENFKKWASLTDYMYAWFYSTNFNQYMWFFDSFSFTADIYAAAAKFGVNFIYNQGQSTLNGRSTAFHALKTYLDAKLEWNSSLNIETLIDNFFNAMYKDAAPAMKNIFYEVRGYNYKLISENGLLKKRSIYQQIMSKKYWNLNLVTGWQQEFDAAKELVKKYSESDPELYQMLIDHIEVEWVSPAYISAVVYGAELDSATYNSIVARLKADVEKYSIAQYAEHKSMSDITNAL